jgi:hypothetical protein
VSDLVRMVWTGHVEKFLKMSFSLLRLALEVTFSGRDMLLIRAIHFLVIVITAGSNCDPLGASLLSLFAALSASLSSFAVGFGWCPPAIAGDRFPIVLNEDSPDRLFTRSIPGGNIKQLLHGLRLIVAKFMH